MAKTLKEFLESYDFNRAALAKQRLQNLRHAGGRVRGARVANLMRAAGLREEEMDETDLDQLDEVLSADAKASDWIHDFVHSTNPKFEGKSKKERIKMALGAYYGKQNEEVELDEAVDPSEVAGAPNMYSADTVKKAYYHKKASDSDKESLARHLDRYHGNKEWRKPVKEEIEQIDELSKGTLGSYVKSAARDVGASRKLATDFEHSAKSAKKQSTKDANTRLADKFKATAQKRHAGIGKAVERLTKEETELEEGRFNRDDAYTRDYKSSISGFGKHQSAAYRADGGANDEGWGKDNSQRHERQAVPHAVHINGKKWKSFGSQSHAQNVANKIKGATVHKEEFEIEENFKVGDMVKPSTGPHADHPHEVIHVHDDGRVNIKPTKLQPSQIKYKLGAVTAKAHQIQKISEAAEKPSKDDPPFDPDPPKKNASAKPGKYGQGYSTARHLARQGMKKAMKEEYGVDIDDETADQILEAAKQYAGLEKEDKKGLPTAVIKTSKTAVKSDTVEGWDHPNNAVKKESFDSEGNLITSKISFKEFSTLLEYTPGPGGVTRIQGRGYGNAKGAKYGNTDYDNESLEKKDDEGEEQVKRGRGRPAGAKSGARGPRSK